MPMFRPIDWHTSTFMSPAKTTMDGIPDQVRGIRFPFRLMRYWIVHELLKAESKRRGGVPLSVCEIGIDAGQMLAFSKLSFQSRGQALPWRQWDGMDCSKPDPRLQKVGYDRVLQVDLEDREQLAALPRARYDVVILLHVLEHLHCPGPALAGVEAVLKPGGLILGGCPTTPEWARNLWQRRLRRNPRPRGHVTVISTELLRRWADFLGLQTELLSGAFFMRKKGFRLENHAWWLRLNLAFGALFPSWPGEIYWAWRKPADKPPA